MESWERGRGQNMKGLGSHRGTADFILTAMGSQEDIHQTSDKIRFWKGLHGCSVEDRVERDR